MISHDISLTETAKPNKELAQLFDFGGKRSKSNDRQFPGFIGGNVFDTEVPSELYVSSHAK